MRGVHLSVWFFHMYREEADRALRKIFQKDFGIFMVLPTYPLPVVESGAFELGVGQFKAEPSQKNQVTAGGCAEPGDVAGVGGNLGFVENDVQRRIVVNPHRCVSSASAISRSSSSG